MAATTWTTHTEALLTRLWTEEGRTFAEIAEAVTKAGHAVSRSAVSGRIRKLGLVGIGKRKRAEAPSATKPESGADLSTAGGAEPVLGMPMAEQDQGVEVVTAPEWYNEKACRESDDAAERNFIQAHDAVFPDAPEAGKVLVDRWRAKRQGRRPEPTSSSAGPSGEAGTYRIADLREGQCRFACTGHNVPADQHRFCGAPTEIGPGNLHGSWCPEHLERMFDRSSRLARPSFLKRAGDRR